MHIQVHFIFRGDAHASAATGAEGAITDMILPACGDVVHHRDFQGQPFVGRVEERIFSYNLPHGTEVDGHLVVTVVLSRVTLQ